MTTNDNGYTVLHLACISGNLDVVQLVVESYGECINFQAKTKHGETALHHACIRNSSLEMIRYLIEKCHLNAQVPNNQGWTALQWACIHGNLATVRYLVDYGGSNAQGTTDDGSTALHYTCGNDVKGSHVEVARYLVKSSRVHVNATDHKGWTPLLKAARGHSLEMVQFLLESCGADIRVTPSNENGTIEMIMLEYVPLYGSIELRTYLKNKLEMCHPLPEAAVRAECQA
jgi:ankyrin repeat protein